MLAKNRTELRGLASALVNGGTSLRRDESGTTAVIFAITFSFIFLIVAMAIDYGMASNEKICQQAAIDAATLAASEKLGLDDQDNAGPKVAQAFYEANTRAGTRGALEEITLDATTGTVRALGNGWSMTSLLNGINIPKLNVATGSRVTRGVNNVEIALVLDNSGSMSGQPIADLQTAANNLLSVIFAGNANSDRVRVGVVPFAGSVNVGPEHRDAYWIDGSGASSIHYQNFSTNRTRFQLLSDMGVAWGGCVEARPAPYDTQDTEPTTSSPDTLFVPMFAPDEPDKNNSAGASYPNNYLVDDAGACTPQPRTCTKTSKRGVCQNWSVEPLDPAVAQSRVCKYVGQAPAAGTGPNYNCTTQKVLPLTSTKAEVESTIAGMVANGTTNIGEGVMWGLRVLSPEAPFTEGREWSEQDNAKYLVLMTDGENTYSTYNNINKSWYGAFGFASKDRLGTTYTQTAIKDKMDAKTKSACATAKAKGVTIFTVAFRLEADPYTRALLSECATTTDRAYSASDGAALIKAFEQIGREISTLRVSG